MYKINLDDDVYASLVIKFENEHDKISNDFIDGKSVNDRFCDWMLTRYNAKLAHVGNWVWYFDDKEDMIEFILKTSL